MAIYHLSIKIISRSGGKSAVAAAAYRAGEKLTEAETGYVHDYTKKEGVVYTEVMLPEYAPPEYCQREVLWNEVQKIEKKAGAQMAREIEVALPIELSREEQIEIVRKYVMENFLAVGMCADIAIHEKQVDDKRVLHQNPHAHILLTTRAFKEDGTWAAKEKKTYALDEKGERIPVIDPATGLQKVGKRNEKMWKRVTVLANDWNDQSNAEKWRQSWADMCNVYLSPEKQMDHRSYERQGLEQIPTIHEGYVARQMEQRGEVSERMEQNRSIKRFNRMFAKLQTLVAGLGEHILKLKEDLRRVSLYERFEQLQRRRAAGSDGRTRTDAGRVGAEGHTDKRNAGRTGAAADLIRMAESTGTIARASDTNSRAIVDNSTAGREYRETERKRQVSDREQTVKERKRTLIR